jgi:PEP-CTERM motif
MKKIIITGTMIVGLSLGALAQGSINLENADISPGVALNTAGNYFSGTYSLQVWLLNSTAAGTPTALDGMSAQAAESAMIADGFIQEASFIGQTITAGNAGTFNLGEVDMAGVTTAGSSVTIALLAWTGSSASWNAAVSAGANGGLISFINPTADYTVTPHPTAPSLTGWNSVGQDLVMTKLSPVPEPTTLALAGLGALSFLGFRRRKA